MYGDSTANDDRCRAMSAKSGRRCPFRKVDGALCALHLEHGAVIPDEWTSPDNLPVFYIAVLKETDPVQQAPQPAPQSVSLSAVESERTSSPGAAQAGTNAATPGPSGLAALSPLEKPRPVATTRQEQRRPAKTKGA